MMNKLRLSQQFKRCEMRGKFNFLSKLNFCQKAEQVPTVIDQFYSRLP